MNSTGRIRSLNNKHFVRGGRYVGLSTPRPQTCLDAADRALPEGQPPSMS